MKYAKQQIIKAASDANIPSEMLRLLLMHLPGGSRKETWNYYVSELIASGAPVDFIYGKGKRGSRCHEKVIPRFIMIWIGRNILCLSMREIAQRLNYVNHTSCVSAIKQLESLSMQPDKYFKPYLHLDFVRNMIAQNNPKVKKYLVS